MLSGEEIINQIGNGNIVIRPFNKECINPNSYNLHLGNKLLVYDEKIIDAKKENTCKEIIIPEEGYVLQPNKLYLGRTVEYTEKDKFVPMLNGRSSIGRLGLNIHVTAGFGDNGFKGTWTLELFTVEPLRIYPNMELCQICYFSLIGNPDIKYQGKYLNQEDVTKSKLFTEYND